VGVLEMGAAIAKTMERSFDFLGGVGEVLGGIVDRQE
jgi:hypothetical protein